MLFSENVCNIEERRPISLIYYIVRIEKYTLLYTVHNFFSTVFSLLHLKTQFLVEWLFGHIFIEHSTICPIKLFSSYHTKCSNLFK
jgi:hypothetical protein